jgi:hypothetical protein
MAFISPEFLDLFAGCTRPRHRDALHHRHRPRAGRRRSFAAAFGCTLGIIPHMLAAVTGLAAILHRTPALFGW